MLDKRVGEPPCTRLMFAVECAAPGLGDLDADLATVDVVACPSDIRQLFQFAQCHGNRLRSDPLCH